jgi:hypothetical protein
VKSESRVAARDGLTLTRPWPEALPIAIACAPSTQPAISDYSNLACATTGTDTVLAVVAIGIRGGKSHKRASWNPVRCELLVGLPQGYGGDALGRADGGSTFAGWDGAACSGAAPCIVILNETTMVRATFELSTPSFATLTVDRDGEGHDHELAGWDPVRKGRPRDIRERYSGNARRDPLLGLQFHRWSGGGL